VKAAETEEAAQKACAHKEREQAKWIDAPPELFRKLTAVHGWEIAHHEPGLDSIYSSLARTTARRRPRPR
jgi:hypothetical protein